MKIELKRISFSERMSEETSCFVADIYIDGKKVGSCKNDGRGGCTEYHGNTKADNELIEKAEEYCKTLPKIKSSLGVPFGVLEYDMTFEGVIDDLLEAHLKAKDLQKFNKKMQKHYATAICYGKKLDNGCDFATTFWKGRTLAQVPLVNLQETYDKIKAFKLQKGDVILNDNLEALGVKL
jgi:hypothetical protein